MTLWFPKTDLMFHEVEASRIGRFKMWIHYRVLHKRVYPHLPDTWRLPVYRFFRRWVFGPNANYEDLRALLQQITEKLEAHEAA